MDIVIHATKDGHRTLFSTNEEIVSSIEKDVRIGSNDDTSLGQSVYALVFIAQGTVFTKYTIVKDTERHSGLGFIAYALFINFNKTLKGGQIINLLNDLSENYAEKYIKKNYLNRGEKTPIKQEWDFVDDILIKYKEQDNTQKNDELQSGTKDAPFVCYKDEFELREYFDKPFQEEYCDFKQVYFINENLKGELKNPLTVLSNSGEELKDIDLKNEYYYLNNYNPSKGIKIIAKGKERTDRKNNNCIRAKWQVEISYSKDERCYWPIQPQIGSLSNPDSEIYKYLEIKNNQISINYDAFNNPKPKIKTITFEIKDRNGNFIEDAQIQINNKISENLNGHRHECKFIGEDLIKPFYISVNKGNFSGKTDLIPIDVIGIKDIILQEHVKVTFLIKDDNGDVFDYNIQIRNQKGDLISTSKEFELIGEDIDKTYNITIMSNKHEIKEISYNPANDENPKQVKLHIKQLSDYQKDKKYELIINDKFGKRTFNNKKIHQYVNSKPDFGCDPKFGYKFSEWKQQEKSSTDYDGYFEAVFIELWYNKIPKWGWIVSSITIVIFAGFVLTQKPTGHETTKTYKSSIKIQNYLEGDDFLLDTLKKYKNDLETQKPEVTEKNSGLLDWFMWNEKQKDSTALMIWRKDTTKINEAIKKRELLNNKDFSKLLELKYSTKQQNLIKAVMNIDSTKYQDIYKLLGDVSDKKLSAIAYKINEILEKEQSVKDKKVLDITKNDQPEPIIETPPAKTVKKSQDETPQQQTDKKLFIEKNNEIIKYIKGSELKKDRLEDYKKSTTDNSLRNSIDLILKIWKLDGNDNNTYHSIQQLCNNNKFLKESELNTVLKNIKETADYAGLSKSEDILKKLKKKL